MFVTLELLLRFYFYKILTRLESNFLLIDHLSTCLPVYLSTCLPVYLSTCVPIYMSTCLPVYLSICVPVYLLPVYLSTCLPVFLSFSLFACMSVRLSIRLSVCLFFSFGSVKALTRCHSLSNDLVPLFAHIRLS